MKIALAQISTYPGKIEQNVNKIIKYIEEARKTGANLVVFPELTIPGYALMDLAYSEDYLRENKAALNKIIDASKDIAVIAGFIDFQEGAKRSGNRPFLYNSAAIIENRKLLGVQDKTLLPNYDIFFEDRYFSPARSINTFDINGMAVGIQICEDLWDHDYPLKISDTLVSKGAGLIINISASPFNQGKLEERNTLISGLVNKHRVPFIYTNLVGGFDGFEGETIFDGQSLAYNQKGELIAQGAAFKEELVAFELTGNAQKLSVIPDHEETYRALVLGIKEFFKRLGFKRAFIGISGGIDSAVVAALAVEALGKENVTGVTMPSHITSGETLRDSRKLASNLGMKLLERPISPEFEAWKKEFIRSEGKEPASLTAQNKQARIRGAILMEFSNQNANGLVISTGNKTELALGYCTLYGDMCGALSAISDVSKVKVYRLAEYINSRGSEIIPVSIIKRVPTAELEPDQTDRANLPADYPVISPLVDEIVEDSLNLNDLYSKYPKDVVDKTIRLINQNEFKRRQAAPGIRVTKRAFGIGRRMPMGI